ncbi:MAG: hypothetical protein IKU99_03585 [Clostridia bacterium]|nr:hypothetical protein [Clostridia bacterium]
MNKINMSFFNAYLELDKACAKLLEVSRGGATAYINKLAELRFAPERSEVLPKLLRYRKIRNIIAHEEGAFSEVDEITKADIKWINRFTASVNKKRDPVSRYERKAKINAVWSKVKLVLGILILLALAVVVVSIAKNNI